MKQFTKRALVAGGLAMLTAAGLFAKEMLDVVLLDADAPNFPNP